MSIYCTIRSADDGLAVGFASSPFVVDDVLLLLELLLFELFKLRSVEFTRLAALVVVLGAMGLVLHSKPAMIAFVGLLGVAAFATVAPLQLRVLEHAHGAGQNLASSLNIAAFNLGNALGAWLGGVVIASGAGLVATPWVAAVLTALGLGIALWSVQLQRRQAALPAGCVQGR